MSTTPEEHPVPLPAKLGEPYDSFGRLITLPVSQDILPPTPERIFPKGIVDLAHMEDLRSQPEQPEEPDFTPDLYASPLRIKGNDTEQASETDDIEVESPKLTPQMQKLISSVKTASIPELLELSVGAEVDGNLNVSVIVDNELSNRVELIRKGSGGMNDVVDLFLERKRLADERWAKRAEDEDSLLDPSIIHDAQHATTVNTALSGQTSEGSAEIVAEKPDSLLKIAQKWQELKGDPEVIESSKQTLQAHLKQIYLDLETGVDPLENLEKPEEIELVVALVNSYLKDHLRTDDGSTIDSDIVANLSYALHKRALEKFRPKNIPRPTVPDSPIRTPEIKHEVNVGKESVAETLKSIASEWESSGRSTDVLKKDSDQIKNILMLMINDLHTGIDPLTGVSNDELQPLLDLVGNYLSKLFVFNDKNGSTVRLSTRDINVFVSQISRHASNK